MEVQVRRPAAPVAVGVVLGLTALVSAVAGLAVSWASSCCGSVDGSDPLPAVLGIAVAILLALAAAGLVGGWMRPALVVPITAVVPVACLVAASTSSDLAGAAPFALAGWGVRGLARQPTPVAAWLSRDRTVEPGGR